MMDKIVVLNNRNNSIESYKRPHIRQLDGVRIILCLVIVFSHCEFLKQSSIGDFYHTFLQRGSFAVEFFFLISGFGIYYNAKGYQVDYSIKSCILFAIRRIRRIYPVYIFSILVSCIYAIPSIINICVTKLNAIIHTIIALLFSIVLIQSLTGVLEFSRAFNSVGWFLSSLFISYIFCPLLIRLVNAFDGIKKSLIGGISALLLIVLFSYLAVFVEKRSGGLFNDLFYSHPLVRCIYLLCGMFLANIYIELKGKNIKVIRRFVIVSIFLYLVYFFARGIISYYMCDKCVIRVFDITVTSLLLLGIALDDNITIHLLKRKSVQCGVKYIMYIYLLHYPVSRVIVAIDRRGGFTRLFDNWSYFIEFIVFIFFTIIACIFALYMQKRIERMNTILFDKMEEFITNHF